MQRLLLSVTGREASAELSREDECDELVNNVVIFSAIDGCQAKLATVAG